MFSNCCFIITRYLLNSQILCNQFLFVFWSNWTKKDKQKRNISKCSNYNFFAGDFLLWLAILKTTLTSIHAVNLTRLIKNVDINMTGLVFKLPMLLTWKQMGGKFGNFRGWYFSRMLSKQKLQQQLQQQIEQLHNTVKLIMLTSCYCI